MATELSFEDTFRVRSTALKHALDYYGFIENVSASDVVNTAKTFENYMLGVTDADDA